MDHVRFSRHFMGGVSKFCSGLFDNWGGGKKAEGEGEGGGGGGGDGKQPVKQAASEGGTKKNNDGADDTTTDDDLVDTIFQQDATGADTTLGADGKPRTSDNNVQIDPDKQLNDYLKKIGLEPVALTEAELESFKSGDGVQAVLDGINKKIVTSHLKAMEGAQTLIDAKVAKAVKDAVGSSAELMRDEKARTALQEKLPWAKAPAFAPIAESILKKFLIKTGNNVEKAVALTKVYFDKQAQAMDPDALELNTNTGGNNRRARGPQGVNTNWVGLLTGKE